MIHSKSIQVLKTLSKEELSQFGDFVSSPFHNKKPTLVKLFEVLKKFHPEYEVENEELYSKIYPGKEYNHDNMKKLMAEEFLILEKFLVHTKIKKENFTADKYLLEEYMQRKVNELFLFKVKKVNEKIDEVNNYVYDFHDKFHLEDLICEFYGRNNIEDKLPINALIHRSEYLLCNFLETALSVIASIRRHRPQINKLKENLIIEWFLKSFDIKIFLKYLSDKKIKNNFILLQISLILMFIYPENETYFKKAKTLILDLNNFVKKDYEKLMNYLIAMENYCLEMIFKGKKRYRLEVFEIHKHHLKIILSCNNKILNYFYLNLIKNGLFLNELTWVENFINDNTKYLEDEEKENTYNFAIALLEFAKQDYEKSLNYCSKLSIRTSYYYKMEINILILKCYFELSLYDSALSLIDSSKHYLSKTDELNFDVKQIFSEELSIMYKLHKFKINSNYVKSDLINLKSEITSNLIRPEWCLQKIEELEKSIPVKALRDKLNKKPQSKKLLKSA